MDADPEPHPISEPDAKPHSDWVVHCDTEQDTDGFANCPTHTHWDCHTDPQLDPNGSGAHAHCDPFSASKDGHTHPWLTGQPCCTPRCSAL